MAYIDIYSAATDAAHVLRKQVAVAVHKQALIVLAENPATANHGQREALAQRALRDPVAVAAVAIWRILENPTVAGAPTEAGDALVLTVMGNSWDALSKAQV